MIYWLQITSGRGPEECCWVVFQLVKYFQSIAPQNRLRTKLIEAIPGKFRDTMSSALIAVEADHNISDFLVSWEGSIQWVGTSMYRPHHKRKNWFVSVKVLKPVTKTKWNAGEIKIERMRSSGPGGQHANKTESAIRVTHLPTGLTSISQEERSQYLNKKLALLRLEELLRKNDNRARNDFAEKCWSAHNLVERGNARHVFSGKQFILTSKINK